MRMAMEEEMMYAREFPFVDYGVDLKIMAEMEKGVRITKLSKIHADTAKVSTPREITKDVKEDTARYLENMRARRQDKIPIKF